MSSQGLDSIFNRTAPSEFETFIAHPGRYIATHLYRGRLGLIPHKSLHTRNNKQRFRIVCLSDTHNRRIPSVPDGDILIHAGDLTDRGTIGEVQETVNWLDALPHKYKVVIAGNHELCLDANYKGTAVPFSPDAVSWKSLLYLQDTAVVLTFPEKGDKAIKVYGSPRTPKQGNWAFQYPKQSRPLMLQGLDEWRNKIPADIDILVTHGPPRHHLDIHAGCASLLQEIWRVRPRLHVFGHIHVGRGQQYLDFDRFQGSYEKLCDGEGGVVDVLVMLLGLLVTFIRSKLGLYHKNKEGTMLVNAASVRGIKNDLVEDPAITAIIDF